MIEISTVSIVSVIISTILSVFVPFIFLLIGKIKMKGSLKTIFWGVLLYILVVAVWTIVWSVTNMDNILTLFLGEQDSDAIIASFKYGFKAILEIGAIWLFFYLKRKKYHTAGSAITFGSVFAFCACAIYSALLIMCIVVIIGNAMGKDMSLSFIFGQLFITNQKVDNGGLEFLIYGLRSLYDCAFYLSVSVILFASVDQNIKWPLVVSFLFDLARTLPVQMSSLNLWYWGNTYVIMIALAIISIIIALIAYKTYSDYYKDKEAILKRKRAKAKAKADKKRKKRAIKREKHEAKLRKKEEGLESGISKQNEIEEQEIFEDTENPDETEVSEVPDNQEKSEPDNEL